MYTRKHIPLIFTGTQAARLCQENNMFVLPSGDCCLKCWPWGQHSCSLVICSFYTQLNWIYHPFSAGPAELLPMVWLSSSGRCRVPTAAAFSLFFWLIFYLANLQEKIFSFAPGIPLPNCHFCLFFNFRWQLECNYCKSQFKKKKEKEKKNPRTESQRQLNDKCKIWPHSRLLTLDS